LNCVIKRIEKERKKIMEWKEGKKKRIKLVKVKDK
jgi:hypothetical protein